MRIPAPPDSSKLVLLRVCLDILLCVSQSVRVAVGGARSFFPPAVTPGVPAAWMVHASSATLPRLPTKAGLLSDFFSRCGPFGPLPRPLCYKGDLKGVGSCNPHLCYVMKHNSIQHKLASSQKS